MTATFLKPLLIGLLAASMLVGCTELPTSGQKPQTEQTPSPESTPITAQGVKAFLSEFQQKMAVLRSLSGASKELASAASSYRTSGYAIAQNPDPWAWQDKAPEADGTVESTRHVIEEDAEGAIVTDIQSTRRMRLAGGTWTVSLVEVVTKSPVLRPGTYRMEGRRVDTHDPAYESVREQTTAFTPLEGGPASVVTFQGGGKGGDSFLKVSGTLPDGSTVAYESTMLSKRQGSGQTDSTEDIDYAFSLKLIDSEGKTLVAECQSLSHIASTTGRSVSEGKSAIIVSLGSLMKVRFDADTRFVSSEASGTWTSNWERFNLTAELQDGTGKRIAPIELDLPEGSTQPSNTARVTLPGEEPAELDLLPVFSLLGFQLGMLPNI